jgi:hypothetical protein
LSHHWAKWYTFLNLIIHIVNNFSISQIAPECCFVITVDFKGAEPFTCSLMCALSFKILFTVEVAKSNSHAMEDRLWLPSYFFKIFILCSKSIFLHLRAGPALLLSFGRFPVMIRMQYRGK